jgi:aspartyl aminopeptidase
VQEYSHRGDLPCGSTIGPLAAAGLAVDTVDVGAPQLSMHSARELMAAADVAPLVDAFTAWIELG